MHEQRRRHAEVLRDLVKPRECALPGLFPVEHFVERALGDADVGGEADLRTLEALRAMLVGVDALGDPLGEPIHGGFDWFLGHARLFCNTGWSRLCEWFGIPELSPLTSRKTACKVRFVVRKNRTTQEPRAFESLNEWMEARGVNGRQLLELLRERSGRVLSEGHLSNILKGSRRCSLTLAIDLNEITGVPIKAIARWPRVRNSQTSKSAA